jgi:hypothetical protein
VDLVYKVGPTKICEFQKTVSIDQNILRFDISVNNVLLVDVGQSLDDLLYVFGSLFLWKSFLWAFGHHTTVQLTLLGILQNKINWKVVFKVIVQLDDVWVVKKVHNSHFSLDMLQQFRWADWLFLDLLDCINITSLFMFSQPHLTKTALSQHFYTLKIVSWRLLLPSCLYSGRQEQHTIREFSQFHIRNQSQL